jgi:ketosteroid isomerase-like protein
VTSPADLPGSGPALRGHDARLFRSPGAGRTRLAPKTDLTGSISRRLTASSLTTENHEYILECRAHRRQLDAVIRRDASAVDRYFAPDVEYMVKCSPLPDRSESLPPISAECRAALPWLGIYHGRDALKSFLAHKHRILEVTAFGPHEVVSEGNKTAAFGWFRLRALSTGRTADISCAILFELQSGLIVRYHLLENTFDVAAAFRAGGTWLIDTDVARYNVPAGIETIGE